MSQIQSQKLADLDRQMDRAIDDMEAVTGIYGLMPRRQVSQPIVHTGPTSYHNIKVDRSVIGTINTGTVQEIISNLNHIQLGTDAKVGEALATFTQSVLADKAIGDVAKQELIDQISTLSAEAATAPNQRKLGVIKAMVSTIGQTASTITTLSQAWEHLRPILEQLYKHI